LFAQSVYLCRFYRNYPTKICSTEIAICKKNNLLVYTKLMMANGEVG